MAGPILAARLKLPGLVGLIFLGMIFGPFVMGWIVPDGFVGVVGAVGLLYLMFLAGIELDINTFVANRRASVTFGLLTFLIPFTISLYVGLSFLGYTGAAAALIGAMWASHTLVAYTEVKAAGLESNRAIGAATSATIITDILALMILGFAASADVSDEVTPTSGTEHLAKMPVWLGVIVLAVFCMWLLPRLTNWFFVNVGRTRTQRFVWTFGAMAAGAFVSILGGMEGLVGAFLAGVGINRLVPAHGQLMERIEFFGSALFVPAFLVAVGMSIDPEALAEPATLRLAAIFVCLVIVGKTLAAVVSGLIFKFSWAEIGMMASLTIGQAAATLAIAQVGVGTGIFDADVLNAAVMAVVVTVLITSFGTRYFARKLEVPAEDPSSIGRNLLLQVPADGSLDGLLDVGVAITRGDDGLLTPFVVCDSGCPDLQARLAEAVQGAIDRGHDSDGVTRISDSTVAGVLNLATEQGASMVLLPWDGPRFPGNLFFGDDIDEIGSRSSTPVAAARIIEAHWNRVLYFQGRSRGLTIRDEDSALALDIARRIAAHIDRELMLYSPDPASLEAEEGESLHAYAGRNSQTLTEIAAGDLVVAPAHVAEDAAGLGLFRVARHLQIASLIVVGGPGRLHVSGRTLPESVVGSAFNRSDRELLATTWETSTR